MMHSHALPAETQVSTHQEPNISPKRYLAERFLASDEKCESSPATEEQGPSVNTVMLDLRALAGGEYPSQNGWQTYAYIRSIVDNADKAGVKLSREFEETAAEALKHACENSIIRLERTRRELSVTAACTARMGGQLELLNLGRREVGLMTSISVYNRCIDEIERGLPCSPPSTRVVRYTLLKMAKLGLYSAPWVTLELIWGTD